MSCMQVLTALAMVMPVLLAGCNVSAQDARAAQPGYVAMVRGEVDVAGGLVKVFAPQSGRVLATSGRLGQRVRAGEVLAVLESHGQQSTLALAEAEAAMARAQQQSAHLERDGAARALARLQMAQAADAASTQSVEEAGAALSAKAALAQVADAEVMATQIRFKAAQRALDETQLRAPVSGELVQVRAAPFMRVAADSATPLFVLLPDAPRIIRAEVNEEFARLLHNGIAAQVVVDDDVEMVINASAVRVASSLRRRESQPEGLEQLDSRVLDCEIEGDFLQLRVGQPVLVRFLKDGT